MNCKIPPNSNKWYIFYAWFQLFEKKKTFDELQSNHIEIHRLLTINGLTSNLENHVVSTFLDWSNISSKCFYANYVHPLFCLSPVRLCLAISEVSFVAADLQPQHMEDTRLKVENPLLFPYQIPSRRPLRLRVVPLRRSPSRVWKKKKISEKKYLNALGELSEWRRCAAGAPWVRRSNFRV